MKTKLQTKIDISTVYFKHTFNCDENMQQIKKPFSFLEFNYLSTYLHFGDLNSMNIFSYFQMK